MSTFGLDKKLAHHTILTSARTDLVFLSFRCLYNNKTLSLWLPANGQFFMKVLSMYYSLWHNVTNWSWHLILNVIVQYKFHSSRKRYHQDRNWDLSLSQTDFNFLNNKNVLTGPANCKQTTRHHAYLSLWGKPRKINNAKSRKWPKTSIWTIFLTISRSDIPNVSLQLKVHITYLVPNFRPKTKTVVRAVFEKIISVWFWANLEAFSRISPDQDFFSKMWLCHFSAFIVP